MDVQALAKALNQAGVDPRRYVLVPLLTEPWAWQLRPEGSVWLVHGRHEWKVESGGIGPHYDAEGPLCTFSGEEQACEVFLREMTGPGEPFAAEKARFSADLVRSWWEDEVRIALAEPSVAAERVAQWGHQKSVLLDNRAAAARYDQELRNHRPRPEH